MKSAINQIKFYNWHQHSTYSIMDSVILIPDLVKEAKNRGLECVYISDHGSLSACYELYRECRNNDIKSVLGIESYFVPNYNDEIYNEPYNYGHIILIAMNEVGWNNIKTLQNIGWERGFVKKPRISLDLLKKYNEGIIITTGCLDGIIGYNLFTRPKYEKEVNWGDDLQFDLGRRMVREMQLVFGDRLYGEIQLNDVPDQIRLNKCCLDICNLYNIPIILTGDTHYMKQDDTVLHDIVICVKWNDKLNDPHNHTYTTKELWYKTNEEYLDAKNKFHSYISDDDLIQYIKNTKLIADRIDDYDILPNVNSMPGFDTGGKIHYRYLVDLCKKHHKYELVKTKSCYMSRFNKEMLLITQKNFVDYFLIVSDICREARQRNIPYNSRGSVCGSLVAYLLEITWIDPIEFNTPFERFLSADRQNMPDIDLDFSRTGRETMIQYLRDKYGDECVAHICNFSIYKPKVAFKDVCRVFNISFDVANKITKKLKSNVEWEDFFKDDDIVEFFNENPNIYKYTEKLLKIIRQYGIHASGILLTPDDITKWCPIAYQKGRKITEWDGSMLEELNLLKIDFLGLNMLDIVDTAIQLIDSGDKDRHPIGNLSLLFQHILDNLNNREVYKFISSGKNVGTFQLGGSSGMMALAKQLKPNRFQDIMALISLYRTAILETKMDQEYVKRKHGKEFDYLHPKMENALKDTYGILLYQFQTCQIAHDLAGFTMLEADHFRNAIKKKNRDKMKVWQDKFISGCETYSNIDKNKSQEIWKYIEAFSEYGFNRSHAASYALLGYTTAWLKCYYPNEYMTALLRHNVDDNEQLFEYMLDCARMQITIIKPNINNSTEQFELKGGKIYAPLNFIKGIGGKALENIISTRNELGKYKSFDNFIDKVERRVVNISIIMKLILSDAFSEFEEKEKLFNRFLKIHVKDKITRQLYCYDCKYRYMIRFDSKRGETLFCPCCNSTEFSIAPEVCEIALFNENYLNEQLYGFNIFNDNLGRYIPRLEEMGYKKLSDLDDLQDKSIVKTVFEIKKIKTHIDKNQNQMAFIEITDNIVYYDLILFSSFWSKVKDTIRKNCLYVGMFKKEGNKLLSIDNCMKEFNKVELVLS